MEMEIMERRRPGALATATLNLFRVDRLRVPALHGVRICEPDAQLTEQTAPAIASMGQHIELPSQEVLPIDWKSSQFIGADMAAIAPPIDLGGSWVLICSLRCWQLWRRRLLACKWLSPWFSTCRFLKNLHVGRSAAANAHIACSSLCGNISPAGDRNSGCHHRRRYGAIVQAEVCGLAHFSFLLNPKHPSSHVSFGS